MAITFDHAVKYHGEFYPANTPIPEVVENPVENVENPDEVVENSVENVENPVENVEKKPRKKRGAAE